MSHGEQQVIWVGRDRPDSLLCGWTFTFIQDGSAEKAPNCVGRVCGIPIDRTQKHRGEVFSVTLHLWLQRKLANLQTNGPTHPLKGLRVRGRQTEGSGRRVVSLVCVRA
ncbi:hypothetical protein JZ751_017181 [Albula glossodonta]|uniref:Uncharacterized protein n=1 Tax=Albula glossodonta TaxID=121402 RepID=A0A8T2NSW4_9TELE|nr:hypothetical protein JZ751_017181 [Albula glossodonta]